MNARALAPPGGVAFALPAVLLALWWAATHNHPHGLIPPPDQILRELGDLVGLAGDNDEFSGSLWENLLPSALPGIFTGLRLGLGFAWVVIVVGELSGVRVGLGAMIENAREVSRTDVVIAGMIVIGLAGFLSDQGIRAISRYLLRWNPQ